MAFHTTELGGAIDSTHIYYNISVTNNYTDGIVTLDVSGNVTGLNKEPTDTLNRELKFLQYRSAPYLVNPSEYFMSVMRFTVDTPTLPILIVQPRVGSSYNGSTYSTVYTITMEVNGVATRGYVEWTPTDLTLPLITGPITARDQTNPLFFCYSVFTFLFQLNLILKGLYASVTGYQYAYPAMQFDETTKLFTLVAPVENFRTANDGTLLGTDTQVKLYFNAELYNLFSSLPSIYNGGTNGRDYQLLFSTGTNNFDVSGNVPYVTNLQTNNYYTGQDPYNDVISTQEYPTIGVWNPVKSLVFRANIISPVPELVGTPYIVSSSLPSYEVFSQNANIEQVLIDHLIPNNRGFDARPTIYYEPTGEYTLTDLQGNEPVNGLAITCYWKDWQNQLHPFILGLGCSATIKILFRKKIFNSLLL
jgi:hypothetical protein